MCKTLNIFKTTNAITLAKTILESLYKILQILQFIFNSLQDGPFWDCSWMYGGVSKKALVLKPVTRILQ